MNKQRTSEPTLMFIMPLKLSTITGHYKLSTIIIYEYPISQWSLCIWSFVLQDEVSEQAFFIKSATYQYCHLSVTDYNIYSISSTNIIFFFMEHCIYIYMYKSYSFLYA